MTDPTIMNAPWSAKGGYTATTLIKSLPSRSELLIRSPWSLERATHDILACGEKLTAWERKLVFLASRYPENFDAITGGFRLSCKARGDRLPNQWERDLVLAALEYPFDLADAESKFYHVALDHLSQPMAQYIFDASTVSYKPLQNLNLALPFRPSANQGFYSGRNSRQTVAMPSLQKKTSCLRFVPDSPRSYSAQDTVQFRDLKKRILSNAHAYYAHRFPKADRFDLITSSTTPTGRLDSVEFRCALIVYPNPKSKNWLMLYKSNSCPTIEDAAFEVKYWVEEDMNAMFDKMEAGDTWAVDAKGENEVLNEGKNMTGDMEDTTDFSMSPGTVISNDSDDRNPGSTSDTDMPDLKRKARANNGGEERTKSVKTDNEGRLFVGRKKEAVQDKEQTGAN